MKKILIIIFIVVIIVGVMWWRDYIKIIEEPIDITKEVQRGYKIEETENTITLTIYTYLIPRIITIFYFEDDVYTHATFTRVYKSKFDAKMGLNEDFDLFHNRKLNKNAVSGDIDITVDEDKDSYIKTLDDTYRRSCVKVN